MTRASRLFLSAAIGAIILIAGHAAASAQCPPGPNWTQKTKGITWGGCLFEVTYCYNAGPPVQIIILSVRNMLPFPCGDGTPATLLNTAEQGVIAAEIGLGGEDPDHFWCNKPLTPTVHTVSRSLCYEDRGPALGLFACPGGTCQKTYKVVCDPGTGKLIFTLVAGPTIIGSCTPLPPCMMVPCN